MTMYRQGDLLFVRLDQEIDGTEVPRDRRGRIVLAEGEATGHAHAVLDREARLLEPEFEELVLDVWAQDGVDVVHEEHAPIHLDRGFWSVVRQREFDYTAPAWRQGRWIAD